MNNERKTASLKDLIIGSSYVYGAVMAIVLGVMAPVTYFTARAFEAEMWYAVILAVAVDVLCFCCLRVWLEEDSLSKKDSNAYVVLAGALAFVGIIMTYITLHIFPFGDHTALIIDMHHQYVTFFTQLRERLVTGSSLLYSDNLGLGGGFLPLFAYYLASPLNLLTLLFPADMITEAIALITVLKVTAAGVTFAIFAKGLLKRNDFSVTVCGVAYAMMSFMLCHSWNIMWLDSIILLPIVALGLEKLLKDGKPLLYCLSLAAALMTNYYIGYMICVYMVVYYFAYVISDEEKHDMIYRAQRFWRFCYGSLIGGGISAILILPAFYYLRSTSGAEDSFSRELASNFNILELFQRSLFSAYPSMRGDNLPNIYCSVLALLLLVVFVTCRNIPLRRRAAWGGAALFLALSMSVNWLNFAWHGFHFPNDLPYRFSFLLSFTMLCIMIQVFNNIDKLTARGVAGSLIALIAMLLLEQEFGDEHSDFRMIYVSMAFIAVYAVLMALTAAKKLRQGLSAVLVLLFLFVEVSSNASVLMQELDANEYFTERQSFVYDIDIDRETFKTINGYGDDMYREELLPRKTCNDASLFDYDGLTVFASSNRKSVTTLMGKLGYGINGVNSYLYKNFVPVSDSVLGLRYIALNKEIANHHQLSMKQTVSGVDSDGVTYYRYIHENTKALSKAFMVNSTIIGWQWENENPFVVQNSLLTSACGAGSVYDIIYLYGDSSGYGEDDGYAGIYDDFGEFEDFNGDTGEYVTGGEEDRMPDAVIDGFNCTGSINGTYFSCTKISEELDAKMDLSQEITKGGQYFIYIDCRAAESMSVSTTLSGSDEPTTISASPNEPNVIDLGYVGKGGKIGVNVNTEISCGGHVFLASLNEDEFNDAIARLSQEQLVADSYDEGRISGTVTAARDGMMFTSIPYDSGWTVKVDGKKVPAFALGDALLCFAVPEGTHTVTMTYFPSAFLAGLLITLLSVAALLVLTVPKLRAYADGVIGKYRANRAAQRAQQRELARAAAEAAAAAAAIAEDSTPDGFEDDFPEEDAVDAETPEIPLAEEPADDEPAQ